MQGCCSEAVLRSYGGRELPSRLLKFCKIAKSVKSTLNYYISILTLLSLFSKLNNKNLTLIFKNIILKNNNIVIIIIYYIFIKSLFVKRNRFILINLILKLYTFRIN